jgi:hypothetical protein
MAITYEWSFPNFEVDGSDNVQTVHWRLTATDSEAEMQANLDSQIAASKAPATTSRTKEF